MVTLSFTDSQTRKLELGVRVPGDGKQYNHELVPEDKTF